MGIFGNSPWGGAAKPQTIDDDKWDRIQKAAGRAEVKRGGMFGKKAADQRAVHGKIVKNAKNN